MVNEKGIQTDDSKDEDFSRSKNENFIEQEALQKTLQTIKSNHRGYPREDSFAETTA